MTQFLGHTSVKFPGISSIDDAHGDLVKVDRGLWYRFPFVPEALLRYQCSKRSLRAKIDRTHRVETTRSLRREGVPANHAALDGSGRSGPFGRPNRYGPTFH